MKVRITPSQIVWLDRAAKNQQGLYCEGPSLVTARALARKGLARLVVRDEGGYLYQITAPGRTVWKARKDKLPWNQIGVDGGRG